MGPYERMAVGHLRRLYNREEVECEWYAFRGEGGEFYSPRVDIAVGPFAIRQSFEARYADLLYEQRGLIDRLIAAHNENVGQAERVTFEQIAFFNENSRCLLCIEIENTGGRKHCLENLVNASALGRIGLLIAGSEKILRTFVKQRPYLRFLSNVGKNTFRTDNTLLLSKPQFEDCLIGAVEEAVRARAGAV